MDLFLKLFKTAMQRGFFVLLFFFSAGLCWAAVPDPITDLTVTRTGQNGVVRLDWTAPANQTINNQFIYRLRYSVNPITYFSSTYSWLDPGAGGRDLDIFVGTPKYRYLKWVISQNRGAPAEAYVEVGEFTLFKDGVAVSWPVGTTVSNPGGNDAGAYFASQLIDNNSGAIWADLNFATNGGSTVIFDVGAAGVEFNQYQFYVTNNLTKTPFIWKLYGSNDQITWNLLDSRTKDAPNVQGNSNMYSLDVPTTTASTNPSALISGLTPGVTYYFAILTKNDSGLYGSFTTDGGANANAFGWGIDTAPNPPTGLIFSGPQSGGVTVSYTLPALSGTDDRALYRIYSATSDFTSSNDSWVKISSEAAHPISSVGLTGLDAGGQYFFNAACVDSQGLQSAFSSVAVSTYMAPNVPGGLTGTIAFSSIVVNWTASSNPLNVPVTYQLQVSLVSNFSSVLTNVFTTLSSATIISLSPSTTYYFRIRSMGPGGMVSPYSGTFSTTTIGYSFSPIVDLTATPGSQDGSINVGWTSGPSENFLDNNFGYYLRYSTTSFSSFSIGNTPLISSANVGRDIGVFLSTPAFRYVKWEITEVVSGSIASAAEFTLIRNGVALSWPSGKSATNPSGSGGSTVSRLIDNSVSAVWSDSNLSANGFSVAIFDAGVSTRIAFDSYKWATGSVSSSKPKSWKVYGSINGTNWVLLDSKSGITPPSGFLVYGSSFSISGIQVNSLTNPSFTLNGLNPGTTYYFGALAYDNTGNFTAFSTSGGNNTNALVRAADIAPNAVTSFNAASNSVGSSSFTVSFSLPSAPTYVDDRAAYRLYLSTTNFTSVSDAGVFASSQVAHPLTSAKALGLAANQRYFFNVTALDKGDSTSTPGFLSTVLESALGTPSLSTCTQVNVPGDFGASVAADIGSSSITVNWGNNNNSLFTPTSYQVQISTDINFNVFDSSETFLTTATLSGLTPSSTYYLRTRAFGLSGITSAFNTQITTFTRPAAPQPGSFNVYKTSLSISGLSSNFIYYLQISSQNSSGIDFSSVGASSDLTIFGLRPNTTYQLALMVQGVGGLYSVVNNFASTSTLADPVVANGFTVDCTSINVQVQAGVNPLGTLYALEISSDSFASVNFSSIGASTDLTINGLQPNTTYQVGLRAINYSGQFTSRTIIASTSTRAGVAGAIALGQISVNSVTIVWSANGNPLTPPTSYQVQISTDPNFAVFSTSTTFLLTASTLTAALTLNTTHYFRVASYGRGGDISGYNAVFSTFIIPSAPRITTFNVYTTSISANLSLDSNLVGVTVKITTGAFEYSSSSSAIYDGGDLNLTISGLTPNSAYSLFAQISESSSTTQSTITSSTRTLVAVPTVSSFAIYATSIVVVIDNQNNPDTTQVSLSSNSFAQGASSLSIVTGSFTQLILSRLTPNTVYNFDLGAFSQALPSTRSLSGAEISTVTLPVLPQINAIGNLGAFSWISESSITFEWSAGDNPLIPATSYQVLVSTDENFTVYTTSNTFLLSLTTGSLIAQTTYYFRVSANGRNGSISASLSTQTFSRLTAPPVDNLIVNAIGTSSISLSWNDLSINENGYRLISSSGGILSQVGVNQTSATLQGYFPDTEINLRLAAFNAAGASTSTFSISSHTLANPAQNLMVTSVGSNDLVLSWDANANPATVIYEITQSSVSADFNSNVSTPVSFSDRLTLTTATLRNLALSTTYYFRVRGQNRDGVSTEFSLAVSTGTLSERVIISTGGILDAGQTMLVAGVGISIKTQFLEDGTTHQILLSTESANAVYSNGFTLTLSSGTQVNALAQTRGLIVSSTQSLLVQYSDLGLQVSSGISRFNFSDGLLTVILSTQSVQEVGVRLLSATTSALDIYLNPQSGPIVLSVPSQVFNVDAQITVRIRSEAIQTFGAHSIYQTPSIIQGTGIGLELLATSNFNKPVSIALSYRDSDLKNQDPERLNIARYSQDAQNWITLDGQLDRSSKKMTLSTLYGGRYQLVLQTPATDLRDAKIYPNPLRLHQGGASVMTFTNLLAGSKIRIYTVLGEKIRTLIADARGQAHWDGQNEYGQNLSSGIYFAIIRSGEETRTFKLAIEK